MEESSNASVARRADRTNDDNKYRALVEKLVRLRASDWLKFQEHPKKLHSVEFYQEPAQLQVGNRERSKVVVQTKMHVGSITPTRTTPKVQNLHQNSRYINHQYVHQKALKIN